VKRLALDSSIPEALDHYLANYAKLLEQWDSVLAEKNVTKVEIPEEELAAFRATAADPIRAQWIADMEAQGIPGQELYDLVQETLKDAKMTN
ncbi:MAG: C4-dicarboxylate ABC transporter substrate-binding protein, partial [Pseudomonadota bacterium]